jgi:hypothetical protein
MPSINEPYPPGMQVLKFNPTSGLTRAGTVMDIPFDSTKSPHYLILLDDGTTCSVSAADMESLIPKLTVNTTSTSHLLPPFLQLGSKITFDKDGQYHNGFLGQSSNGIYRFSFKSHINKKVAFRGHVVAPFHACIVIVVEGCRKSGVINWVAKVR